MKFIYSLTVKHEFFARISEKDQVNFICFEILLFNKLLMAKKKKNGAFQSKCQKFDSSDIWDSMHPI